MAMRWVSALEKVFPRPELAAPEFSAMSALRGEIFSVQLAYRPEFLLEPLEIEVISPLRESVEVRQVRSVPAEYFGAARDEYTPEALPGLYPDLLSRYDDFRSAPGIWHSLWLTVRIPDDAPAGKIPLALRFVHCKPEWGTERDFTVETPVFTLEVLPVELPQSKLKVTEWLHCDCLCERYHVAPWSEEFFAVLERYLRNMRRHGVNMVYTPLVTPPLDTRVGLERPTFQSVAVELDGAGAWHFDFTRLGRFLALAEQCGMEYFEFSHLFSQWGAKFAPKIMVKRAEQQEEEKYFGWHTASDSAEYLGFLEALLSALGKFLHEKGFFGRSYFHISDEPGKDSLARYRSAAELFRRALPGGKFLDALSHAEFFREGAVQIPVASINHFEEFTDLDLPERWTYYCVSQWDKVTNQFMHFPSARNRVFGVLAYVCRLEGFLHWGYNFWSGQLSTFPVDPYRDPCAGRGFPPGDAFKVYPGPDGRPEDSIRHEVFFDALQDLAALRRLEEKTSRASVLDLIERTFGKLPTMTDYPREAAALLDLRRAVNASLAD